MKYKLLKHIDNEEGNEFDLGTVFELNTDYFHFNDGSECPVSFLIREGYLKEIKEIKRNIRGLKKLDEYFYIDMNGEKKKSFYGNDEIDWFRINSGIAFITEEEAENYLKLVEVKGRLLQSKHKMGVGKEWVEGETNYYIVKEYSKECKVKGLYAICDFFWKEDLGWFTDGVEEFINKNKEDLELYFSLLKK